MLCIELITKSYREIGVIDAVSEPNAEDAELALSKLNTLMAMLKRIDRIDLGYFPQDDVNAELPISDEDAEMIMPILALTLTINFPASVIPQTLPGMAEACKGALLRDAVLENAQEASLDNLPRGSGQRCRGNILTG